LIFLPVLAVLGYAVWYRYIRWYHVNHSEGAAEVLIFFGTFAGVVVYIFNFCGPHQ